jgi:Peptidase family M28
MKAISLRRIAALLAAAFLLVFVIVRQPVLFATRYTPRVHADPARLRADVETLTSMPRCAERGLDAPAAYIAGEMRAAGARVTTQDFTAWKRPYRNVIATFGPANGRPLVIGAHYDAYCTPHHVLPGADDNARAPRG